MRVNEKNKHMFVIKIVVVVIFLAFFVGILIYANYDKPSYTITDSTGVEYETAKVLAVVSNDTVIDHQNEDVLKGSTTLDLKILTGRYKGNVAKNVTNYYSALYNYDVKKGDTVSVRIDTTDVGVYSVSIYNYNRIPLMITLVVIFFVALLLVGGKQGLKAFAGLVFTIVCIVFILLPLCLKGFLAIPLTCVIIFLTSAVCFFLIGGMKKKTCVAALGSFLGVVFAALFGQIAASIGGVTTFLMDEAEALLLVKSSFALKMRGLFISGILIAAMGAVMDVSMTIASAIEEVHLADKDLTRMDLFRSGMKIGRDAMGTMANTLVLAYVGSSLNMMVLIYSYGVSFTQLVNTDFFAIEMIRGVAGSIGIILTVPCVAFLSAYVYTNRGKDNT